MAQTAFGQSHALANAILAVLNALQAAGLFAVPIAPTVRFARRFNMTSSGETELVVPDTSAPAAVEIFPFNENEERLGGSGLPTFEADYQVHLLMLQRVGVGDADDAQVSLLLQTRSQIIEELKSRGLDVSTVVKKYRPAVLIGVKSATETIYDQAFLESKQSFYSSTLLTYKAAI
jgi:hypothetical protein